MQTGKFLKKSLNTSDLKYLKFQMSIDVFRGGNSAFIPLYRICLYSVSKNKLFRKYKDLFVRHILVVSHLKKMKMIFQEKRTFQ